VTDIVKSKISSDMLLRHLDQGFGDMVKIAADIEQGIIALGGMLHADAEELLIRHGSKQSNVWGANIYPWEQGENRIEYTALINIRPAQDNPSMFIQNAEIRNTIKNLIERLIIGPHEKLV